MGVFNLERRVGCTVISEREVVHLRPYPDRAQIWRFGLVVFVVVIDVVVCMSALDLVVVIVARRCSTPGIAVVIKEQNPL